MEKWFERPATLLKRDSGALSFSCELCESFKNIFVTEYLQVLVYGSTAKTITANCPQAIFT